MQFLTAAFFCDIIISLKSTMFLNCRTLEIRDADEVDEAVRSARFPRATDSPVPGGSSAAAGSHGKPQRPGRAGTKTKVSKFKLDEA